MGNLIQKLASLFDSLATVKDRRILMLGLDGAGKTSLLYRFRLGEVIHTVPTIGFNIETIKYKSLSLAVWDIGGQDRIRILWSYYFPNTDALIWVLDTNDVERIDVARNELHKLLNDDNLRGIPVLIFANKQDLPHAASVSFVADALQLTNIRDRKWHVQGCAATTGDGIYEGLEWLAAALRGR